MKTNKGFTLVEIMIVIVIITLLAAMAIPAFQRVKYNSIENRYKKGEKLSKEQLQYLQEYREDHGKKDEKFVAISEYTSSSNTSSEIKIDKITIDGKEYYLVPYSSSYDTVDIKGKRFLTVPAKQ